MTDTNTGILIVTIGSVISTIGAIIIAKLNQIGKTVDGNFKKVTEELETATEALLTLTRKSSHAEGMKDQKDEHAVVEKKKHHTS